MNKDYDHWINNSQVKQDDLERELRKHGGSDVAVEYTKVAFAFPSAAPNQYFLEEPAIDPKSLAHWAESKGYKVEFVPAFENDHRPFVRFTKIAPQ